MKKFSKAKVGGQHLKILYSGNASNSIMTYEPRVQGKYIPEENTVHVFEHTNDEQTRNTLLHELLHAVDIFMGTNLNEEQIVAMTNGIFMLIEDNKPLMKELLKI